jgi:uncharacterized protein (UPF0276 family)
MLVKIKDNPGLVRDTHSKAILNTDRAALNEYLMKAEIARKQNLEREDTKMRLLKLEENMSEIKSLLSEIVQLRNK